RGCRRQRGFPCGVARGRGQSAVLAARRACTNGYGAPPGAGHNGEPKPFARRGVGSTTSGSILARDWRTVLTAFRKLRFSRCGLTIWSSAASGASPLQRRVRWRCSGGPQARGLGARAIAVLLRRQNSRKYESLPRACLYTLVGRSLYRSIAPLTRTTCSYDLLVRLARITCSYRLLVPLARTACSHQLLRRALDASSTPAGTGPVEIGPEFSNIARCARSLETDGGGTRARRKRTVLEGALPPNVSSAGSALR